MAPGAPKQPGAPHRGVKLARRAQTAARREWPGPAASRCRWGRVGAPCPNGKRGQPWTGPYQLLPDMDGPGPRNKNPKRPSGRDKTEWYPGTLHEEALWRRAAKSPKPTSALTAPPDTRKPALQTAHADPESRSACALHLGTGSRIRGPQRDKRGSGWVNLGQHGGGRRQKLVTSGGVGLANYGGTPPAPR